MKFSLRTFLVVLCVGGAAVGIMGKLLLEDPQMFLAVLMVGTTVGPFLLATGTIIAIGVRSRRRKLALWGVVLTLLPVLAILWRLVFVSTGNPVQLLTTRRIIVHQLPKEIDLPWVWRELKRRLDNGRLTRDDVNDAIRALTTHMKATRPTGWNQPLSWQRDFLGAAVSGKLVSDDVLLELCDAFFGPQPNVKPLPPILVGQTGFQLAIEYGNPWAFNSGIGTDLLWDVKQVTVDGAVMKVPRPNRFAQHWDGFCEGSLAPGDHEVKIEVECAYVDQQSGQTINQAAKIPPSQWPKAKKRWTTTVTVPLKVNAR
jgi:hypothetical protein